MNTSFYKYLLFLLCFTLSINSCEQKEVLPAEEEDILNISQIEKAYNLQYSEINYTSANFRKGNSRQTIEKTPVWSASFIRDISIGKAWIVPLKYKKNMNYFDSDLSLEKISYLMVYLLEEKLTFEIVTKLPKLEKLIDENGQWQGTVLIENLRGELEKGYRWEDGYISHLTPVDPIAGSNLKMLQYCETTDWYTCTSIDGGQSYSCPNTPDYSESTCTYTSEPDVINSVFTYTTSDDYNPGGSGDGSDPDSSSDPSLPDRAESFLESEANAWEAEICEKDNFTNNDCVHGIWEVMKELNVGYEALLRFIGEEPKAELCIDIKDLGTDINGNMAPSGTYTNATLTVNINSNKLARSKLSIARTIIHEMIHAELFSWVVEAGGYDHLQEYAQNASQEDDPFKIIWGYFEKYGSDVKPGWQHEYMADYYDEYISKGLEELSSQLLSPGFKRYVDLGNVDGLIGEDWSWENFYKYLAWQGLQETTQFQTEIVDKNLKAKYDKYMQSLSDYELVTYKCN